MMCISENPESISCINICVKKLKTQVNICNVAQIDGNCINCVKNLIIFIRVFNVYFVKNEFIVIFAL